MNPTPDRYRRLAPHIVIFLAGFTFLIYEVTWNRLLSLVLGATVTASTIVLASFMAGLGLGASYWGRRVDRSPRPDTLPARLFAAIAALAVCAYSLIGAAVPWLYSVLPATGSLTSPAEAAVFVVAAVILMVPTFLMGGIFPAVNRIIVQTDSEIAPTLGRLYAFETLGSSLGGLAAGFVLLGSLGQRSTLGLAVFLNLAVAVWLAVGHPLGNRRERATESSGDRKPQGPEPAPGRKTKQNSQPTYGRIALVTTFVCGMAMLGLQVLWLRIFRIYFTNTSYTFALIASVVVLGLFAGSVLFERRCRRMANPARSMLWAILLMAATVVAGLFVLVYFPAAIMFPLQAAFANPLARILLLPLLASMLIVFPPAVCSGFAFPLACRLYSRAYQTVGRDVGVVLMTNTAGCVAGPLVATFVLIPLLGTALSVVLMIAILIGAAAYILHLSASSRPILLALYLVGISLFALAGFRPDIRILPPSFAQTNREVLFYRESVEGTLSVGRDKGGRSNARYTFVNNAAVIGATYDAIKVVKMVGHFPFLVGGDCRRVLVIGFGIGVTTSAIASHPEVKSIDCVELVPGLKDAAVYYRDLNYDVAADPRLKLFAGDGRHYLQGTSNTYDLISCDPTHPILGSGNLYTKEYFTLCREHLNPGGVVSQYLPLHKLRTEELMGIIATFHSVFPNCTVWLGHYHAVLLGRLEPIRVDFGQWVSRSAALGQDPYFYSDPYHLAVTLALDGPAIERLCADSPINSDDQSYTEFFAPGCLDEDNIARNLRYLMTNRVSPGAVFDNVSDTATMARYIEGNRLLTESLAYQLGGDSPSGLRTLQEACRVNPENQEYPLLIRLLGH